MAENVARILSKEEQDVIAEKKKAMDEYMEEQDRLCAQMIRCKVWNLDLERDVKNRDIVFGRGRTGAIVQIKEGAVVDIPLDVYNQLMNAEAIDWIAPEEGGPPVMQVRKRYLVEVLPAVRMEVGDKGQPVKKSGQNSPKKKYMDSQLSKDIEPGVKVAT